MTEQKQSKAVITRKGHRTTYNYPDYTIEVRNDAQGDVAWVHRWIDADPAEHFASLHRRKYRDEHGIRIRVDAKDVAWEKKQYDKISTDLSHYLKLGVEVNFKAHKWLQYFYTRTTVKRLIRGVNSRKQWERPKNAPAVKNALDTEARFDADHRYEKILRYTAPVAVPVAATEAPAETPADS